MADKSGRLACKDVIEYVLEHRVTDDLVKRIEVIEHRLAEKQN